MNDTNNFNRELERIRASRRRPASPSRWLHMERIERTLANERKLAAVAHAAWRRRVYRREAVALDVEA